MRWLPIVFLSVILIGISTKRCFSACNIIGDKMYGDCRDVVLHTKSKGHLKVKNYREETGIISGATILSGGNLHLAGISEGTITVNKGGMLVVNGQADHIMNYGTVDIEGQVERLHNVGKASIGGIVDSITGNGRVAYRRGAVVGGIPH